MPVQLFSLCSLSALQNSLEWATFWYVKFRSDKRSTALAQLCSRKQFALRSAYRGLIQETMGWEIAGLIGMSSDGQAFHQNKSWAQDWHDPQGAVTFLLLVLMESLLACKTESFSKTVTCPLRTVQESPQYGDGLLIGVFKLPCICDVPRLGKQVTAISEVSRSGDKKFF